VSPRSSDELTASELHRWESIRARRHRLVPSAPLPTADDAAGFVREHAIVTLFGGSALPSLPAAIVGRPVRGVWWTDPEVRRILNVLTAIGPAFEQAPFVLGKQTMFDPALGPPVQRIASNGSRREDAIAHLSRREHDLLDAVEESGKVRMDRWPAPTNAGRHARARLQVKLLVVATEFRNEHGHLSTIVRPWASSTIAKRYADAAQRWSYEDATDTLIAASLHAAVVAPEREVRRWFVFGGDPADRLLATGRAERIGAGRHTRLVAKD